MTYIDEHNKSGLKVGDKVWITCTAISYEKGWNDVWVRSMDKFVGKSGIIKEDARRNGFIVSIDDTPMYYPYFVIKKSEPDNSDLDAIHHGKFSAHYEGDNVVIIDTEEGEQFRFPEDVI